ncbi:MAG: DUF2971 domain-containing protein [Anaerolineales bacterium]|nr:DUF2971 domain-containing protein [Anaerolineales bacterium]
MLDTIVPSKLYKYQSCEPYAFNNLQQRQLWFSKPENFNDPFDSDINFAITEVTEQNMRSLFDTLRESVPDKNAFDSTYTQGGQINDRFREGVVLFARRATNTVKENKWKRLGIACFSEESDNILMWSHYANGHQGFCLEFDTSFPPFKPVKRKTLLRVNYPETNSYPSLSLKDIPHNLPSLVETQLGTKSFQWCYEKEWRIFLSNGNQAYPFDKAALTGIYFGCKMKDADKNTLTEILVDSPARLYQMQKSDTEFKVVAKEIFRHSLFH